MYFRACLSEEYHHMKRTTAVSYTHLDVYKRQVLRLDGNSPVAPVKVFFSSNLILSAQMTYNYEMLHSMCFIIYYLNLS